MLIKKKLKTNSSIISKLKRLPLLIYPACKKQNNYKTVNPFFPFLVPKIERELFEYLPCSKSTKRTTQIKKNILPFLYSVNLLHFQKKKEFPKLYITRKAVTLEKINSKKLSNYSFGSFAQTNIKNKDFQLKVILKSYSNQIKDIKTSVITISKVTNFLKDSFIKKQFKPLLANSSDFSFFNLKSFFNQNNKIEYLKNCKNYYPIISSTLHLLENFKIWAFQNEIKKTNIAQMTLNCNLLIGQPLIEFFDKFNQRNLFFKKTLQKKHYSNRYFFKSLTSLDKKGPISKQVKKTFNSNKLFTVIRSPFVFKKTREQFTKKQVSYVVTIGLDSPIQKQLLIQYLSLLRLPVELEIRC